MTTSRAPARARAKLSIFALGERHKWRGGGRSARCVNACPGEQKKPAWRRAFLRCVAFSIIDYREPFPPSSILRTRRPVFKRRERGGQSRGHAKHARPHRDVQENRHSEFPLVTSSSVMNTPVNPARTQ